MDDPSNFLGGMGAVLWERATFDLRECTNFAGEQGAKQFENIMTGSIVHQSPAVTYTTISLNVVVVLINRISISMKRT